MFEIFESFGTSQPSPTLKLVSFYCRAQTSVDPVNKYIYRLSALSVLRNIHRFWLLSIRWKYWFPPSVFFSRRHCIFRLHTSPPRWPQVHRSGAQTALDRQPFCPLGAAGCERVRADSEGLRLTLGMRTALTCSDGLHTLSRYQSACPGAREGVKPKISPNSSSHLRYVKRGPLFFFMRVKKKPPDLT